jgi:hypothetical protein
MTSKPEDKEPGFLSRWSRRKVAAREPEDLPAADGAIPQSADSEAEAAAVRVEDLPDIDSLEAGSDFSVFMKRGVPEALQRRALRRLWQVDPAFKHICMLDDYNLDYTDAAMVVPNMKTLYQVGKGMVVQVEEALDKVAGLAGEAEPDSAASGDTPALPPDSAAEALPDSEGQGAVPQTTADNPPREGRKPARNPGDPVVTAAPAQRRTAPRARSRSALRRRWGEGEG